MTKKSPLFITGVYRSGTTLPVKILNNHPLVSLTHDTVNFFRYYLDQDTHISERYKHIVNDVADRLSSRFNIEVPTTKIIRALEDDLAHLSMATVYRGIMVETFCNGFDHIIWGEKSLLQWKNIPHFLDMFPDSKAIMILRDPRSTLASYRDFTIESGHKYIDAIFACQHAFKWVSDVGLSLDPHRFRVVYFENIVKDPDLWSREMCEFLKIDYVQSMTDTSQFVDHTGKPWISNTSFQDINGKVSDTIDRWKDKLNDKEVVLTESILGNLMIDHGYELSTKTINSSSLRDIWGLFKDTSLLQDRLDQWIQTGWGTDKHPSDPTNPNNWSKTMLPKDDNSAS